MPPAIEACRAGFWPWPAVRIWPRITSETSAPSTPARLSDSWIATLPSSWAARLAKAPLKAPTGVRAALTMTISSFISWLLLISGWTATEPHLPAVDELLATPAWRAGDPSSLGPPFGTQAQGCQSRGWPACLCRAAGFGTERRQRVAGGRPCRTYRSHKSVAGLKKNRLCCPKDGREPNGTKRGRHGQIGRAGHDQEIRQSAPLQYRHEHLCHARGPRRHGQSGQ